MRSTRSVAVELQGLGREPSLATLVVGRGRLEDPRHRRPGLVLRTLVGRAIEDLDLHDRSARPDGARCPRQSAPVSPPPRMTTWRSSASMAVGVVVAHRAVGRFEVGHRRVHAGELRARHRDQSRARRAEGEHDGVEVALQVRRAACRRRRRATLVWKVTPEAAITARRRSRTAFSSLNSGMP